MAKHRAVIIGAGRIGAGYNWHDDGYTHAGAYRALSDRVELVGFVEPDLERRVKANLKWKVPTYETLPFALDALQPDIVSVCTQPGEQHAIMAILDHTPSVKAVWCEKPYTGYPASKPVQVNYLRRASESHRNIAGKRYDSHNSWRLVVYAKDDIHTRCHFEDLCKWWVAGSRPMPMEYRVFNGPCAYLVENQASGEVWFFDNGGIDAAECMKAMLGNLLDHLEGKAELWSPPA